MIRLTAKIVAAYLRANTVPVADLPEVIRSVHAALDRVAAVPAPEAPLQPAVPPRRSVTADAILCLECGKPQKMLKRHLAASHGLSIDAYRARWSLPPDYPMVAPSYAARRSELARAIGLGTQRRRGAAAAPSPVVAPVGNADGDPDTVPESVPAQPGHRYPASRWSRPVR